MGVNTPARKSALAHGVAGGGGGGAPVRSPARSDSAPDNEPEEVVAQVRDGDRDLVTVRLEGTHLLVAG